MDKTKNSLIIATIVLSIVCILLVGYAATVSSQLNAERSKIAALDGQVADLETKLSSSTIQLDKQTATIDDLQRSLNAVKAEAATLRKEADTLRASNADLESKVNAAVTTKEIPAATPAAQ